MNGALQSLAVGLSVVGFGLGWAAVESRISLARSSDLRAPVIIASEAPELALVLAIPNPRLDAGRQRDQPEGGEATDGRFRWG